MTEHDLRIIEENYENAILARIKARVAFLREDIAQALEDEQEARRLIDLVAETVPMLIRALREERGADPLPPPVELVDWKRRKLLD